MSSGVCALCQKQSDLRDSHIIPKFIFDYIKETSATGFLRNITSVNKRLQDGPKVKLLCGDCEQLFSTAEKYFAEKVFVPYIKDHPESVEYNKNLLYFAASLVFRFMAVNEDFKSIEPKYAASFDTATEDLRQYLLGLKTALNYKLHILPVHYDLSKLPDGMNEKIVWYFSRSADGDIVCTDEYALSYIKLPFFLFFMPFHEGEGLRFKNTEIKDMGTLNLYKPTDYTIPDGFFNYIDRRVNTIFSNPPSKNQMDKINKSAKDNVERVKKSESLKVWLSERKLKKGD